MHIPARFVSAFRAIALMLMWGVPGIVRGEERMEVSEDYVLRTWEISDGLPTNTVTSIAQTPDGYLWLATPAGLVRFDGNRFTSYAKETTSGIKSNEVQTVFTSKEGDIWVGLGKGGVARIRNGKLQTIMPERPEADTSVWITSFAQDAKGAIWFACAPGPNVWRWVDGNAPEPLDKDARVGSKPIVHASTAGAIWLGGTKGCDVFDGTRFQPVDPKGGDWVRLAPARDGGMWSARAEILLRYHEDGARQEMASFASLGVSPKVTALYEDTGGSLWIGTLGSGLFRFRDGKVERVPTSHPSITWITEDREGNVWAGTRGGGLNRLRRALFSMRQKEHSLGQDGAISLCEDIEGRLWVAGAAGSLVRSVDAEKRRFVTVGSQPALSTMALCADPAGGVWMATFGGLVRWKDGVLTHEPFYEALTALLIDRRGDLWMAGIRDGLFRRRNETIERIPDVQGLMKPRALAEDTEGRVWVGTENGLVFRQDKEAFVPVPLPGKGNGQIRFIVPDEDGTVWIGSFEGGLYRWRSGRVTHLPHGKGLSTDDLRSLATGAANDLWIATLRGLVRVSRNELDAVMEGRRESLDCISYSRNEGMPNTDFALGFRGSTTRARDGHVWFATTGGALEIDPEGLRQIAPPASLLIEEIQIGGRWMEVSSHEKLTLPPHPGPLQIRYALPQFTVPEQIRFRYRLVGTGEEQWFLAESQRTAAFTRLPPGNYRFEVGAAQAGGPWLPTTASLDFTVRAAWWETAWFRLATIVASALGLAAMARLVVDRRMRERMKRLEQAHALERERARIARDLHDQVGAHLTQVSLLAELATTPEQRKALCDTTRQAADALDLVVWAADPRKDSLKDLIYHLIGVTEDFLALAGISRRFEIPADVPERELSPEFRHHVLLVVKEALNNVVKYSAATEVELGAELDSKTLAVWIKDNGRGFDPSEQATNGNGLGNMRDRATALGGECRVDSRAGAGTQIFLIVPWTQK